MDQNRDLLSLDKGYTETKTALHMAVATTALSFEPHSYYRWFSVHHLWGIVGFWEADGKNTTKTTTENIPYRSRSNGASP